MKHILYGIFLIVIAGSTLMAGFLFGDYAYLYLPKNNLNERQIFEKYLAPDQMHRYPDIQVTSEENDIGCFKKVRFWKFRKSDAIFDRNSSIAGLSGESKFVIPITKLKGGSNCRVSFQEYDTLRIGQITRYGELDIQEAIPHPTQMYKGKSIADQLDVDQAKKTVEVSIPEEEGVYGFWIEAIDYKKGVINFFFAVDTRE